MSVRVTPSVPTSREKSRSTQHLLLWAGIIAPLLFGTVFMLDGQFKPGYSAYGEAISYLEVGAYGWIQRLNFILFGLLLLAFLVGFVRYMLPILGRGWTYTGAVFLFLSDMGWVTAGLFAPNPFGTPQYIWPAILHQAAFITVFFPLALGLVVLGVKLVFTRGWRIYGFYSLIIGIPMTAFGAIFLIHFFDPAAVSGIVGNATPPDDGRTNRIILFVGPLGWYLISAILVTLRTNQKGEPSPTLDG